MKGRISKEGLYPHKLYLKTELNTSHLQNTNFLYKALRASNVVFIEYFGRVIKEKVNHLVQSKQFNDN